MWRIFSLRKSESPANAACLPLTVVFCFVGNLPSTALHCNIVRSNRPVRGKGCKHVSVRRVKVTFRRTSEHVRGCCTEDQMTAPTTWYQYQIACFSFIRTLCGFF
ncbi:uncharacterized protein LY89DRAFT_80045 [Mollisia scopiformis]|uniref:Uncharacterized protein n=1 Tax=Mollisia scopiformis TaxID=149040 RepID=A0A194X968_MOLSC|nr:uncharacterized protein LY89DRAFT_80045 [Mollisia scopiformis]KUJ16327.1 hypothetical protein LY89DRAFT_80045 [Mollisia scopiformis]